MAQFDVHANRRAGRVTGPYLVLVQSARFDGFRGRLVAPLARLTTPVRPSEVTPHVLVGDETLALVALELASIDVRELGPYVASLAADAGRIIAAIDEVIATAYG